MENPHRTLCNPFNTTTFATISGKSFNISNLFGGPYINGAQTETFNHWFRKNLEDSIMPAIGYVLMTNPVFIDLGIDEFTANDVNFTTLYFYTLFGTLNNLSRIQHYMERISQYYDSR